MRSDLPPHVQDELRRDRRLPFNGWWPVGCGALAGLVLRLLYSGVPDGPYSAMLASFIYGSPLLVGFVTVYVAELTERRSWAYYFGAPVLATVLYVIGTLLLIVEGWICAVIIIPMFAVLGGLAGLLMGAICRVTNWPRSSVVGCFAALPLLFGAIEHRIPSASLDREYERAVFVAASPAVVWRQLIDTRDIRPDEVDEAWMYRIGVPVPHAGVGAMHGGEHLRHITMGKGVRFDQVATEWRENERVSWRYRFSKDSFPAGALDDHVRIGGEYFDVGESTYSLTPVDGGTQLSLRMRYRVSTHFNWYAGRVADFLIADFSDVILRFYSRRAEATSVAPAHSTS
jgi:hypothetical protein